MLAMWEEMGRMLSWSSMTRHFLQDARDRINLRKKTAIVRFWEGRPYLYKKIIQPHVSLRKPKPRWSAVR
jgi:hypothetical protein